MLVDKYVICTTDGLNQKFLVQKNRNGQAIVTLSSQISADKQLNKL
jgi:hypothetical protein